VSEARMQVKRILESELVVEAEQLTPDAHIREDLGGDSLDLVSIVMACEQAFDITLSDEECARVRTVGDLVHLVERAL
jgi:acyl carrier protein